MRSSPPRAELLDDLGAHGFHGREVGSDRGDLDSASQRLFDRFQADGPSRFFRGAVDVSTPALVARIAPALCDRNRAAAEGVLLGRFDLLGYRGLHFGDPIDWHFDPVSGRRSPLLHWSSIDPADAASGGDSKVVWELSRQQFLVTLGSAYRATGDERYAGAFATLVRSWLRANPPGVGINWASSLEAALRIVSWCWALFLFRHSPQLTPALFVELVAGIGAHAAHVERYLSRHSSPNTHLTGEALGLFYAGVLFPESRSAARWRALGQEILEEQVQRQVLEDGVYFEQATAYQRYTVEIYLHYLMLAARNGVSVSAVVGERTQRMLDVLLALRRPDGGMPAIGDADGGSVLPLFKRLPGDTRGVFATAAQFFGRADYSWAAEGLQPEVSLFLGPGTAPLGAPPAGAASRVFAEGGYVVMRSDWQREAHHLVFDVGPLGCPTSAHGHADLLSVQVSAFGDPYVVDPGTHVYCSDPGSRDHFRGTSAHATVVVDGQGQAEPAGPFAWRQRPAARLRSFASTAAFELADASHHAYERLADPVVHRRRVAFIRSRGYWLLVDDLAGEETHRIELRFQFAALPVVLAGGGWVGAVGPRGRGLLLRAFGERPLETRIEEGATVPLEGWVSLDYGQREPAPILVYSVAAGLPLRILTLLLPVEDAALVPPAVEPLLDRDGVPCGLVFRDWGERVRVEAGAVAVEGDSTCRA